MRNFKMWDSVNKLKNATRIQNFYYSLFFSKYLHQLYKTKAYSKKICCRNLKWRSKADLTPFWTKIHKKFWYEENVLIQNLTNFLVLTIFLSLCIRIFTFLSVQFNEMKLLKRPERFFRTRSRPSERWFFEEPLMRISSSIHLKVRFKQKLLEKLLEKIFWLNSKYILIISEVINDIDMIYR